MALIESTTRYPGARPVTLRDHLDIETEGSVSPAQMAIHEAALDAELRKLRLLTIVRREDRRQRRLRALLRLSEAKQGNARGELEMLT